MSLSALLRQSGDAAAALASSAQASGERARSADPPTLRHAPSLNDFSLGFGAELHAQDERLASAAASKRLDDASLRRLAFALESTHLSLRKASPDFEATYNSVQAAAQARAQGAAKARGGSDGAAASSAPAAPVAPAFLRPGSCPPPGLAAWSAHFEERAARGSFRRPGSLDVARPSSRDAPLAPASPRAATPRQAEAHEASRSPSPPPQPQSPGRSAAAAFVAAPHSRLSMDNSVKEALLCSTSF